MTHTQKMAAAKVATPCTAAHITFGGRCMNCGFEPAPTLNPYIGSLNEELENQDFNETHS